MNFNYNIIGQELKLFIQNNYPNLDIVYDNIPNDIIIKYKNLYKKIINVMKIYIIY